MGGLAQLPILDPPIAAETLKIGRDIGGNVLPQAFSASGLDISFHLDHVPSLRRFFNALVCSLFFESLPEFRDFVRVLCLRRTWPCTIFIH